LFGTAYNSNSKFSCCHLPPRILVRKIHRSSNKDYNEMSSLLVQNLPKMACYSSVPWAGQQRRWSCMCWEQRPAIRQRKLRHRCFRRFSIFEKAKIYKNSYFRPESGTATEPHNVDAAPALGKNIESAPDSALTQYKV
jgi:hypothetical protein